LNSYKPVSFSRRTLHHGVSKYVSELSTMKYFLGPIIMRGVPRWGLHRICEFLALTPSLTQNVTHGSILEQFRGRLKTEFLWLNLGNTGGWAFVSVPINFVLYRILDITCIDQKLLGSLRQLNGIFESEDRHIANNPAL